ncbi:hypothetical protein ACFC4S_33555 [Priestia megaterium]|uniref:hypothetical protein n=1 Tax=Priestia megaterium TaxID=1404 RepID=UPI0035D8DB2C
MSKFKLFISGTLLLGIIFTSLFLLLNQKDPVVETVTTHYKNQDGLIQTYERKQDIQYLSESIGLYMQYLVLAKEKKEFDKQVNLLSRHFLVQKHDNTFIKWNLTEGTTNALIDDIRLIDALKKGSKEFKEKRYNTLAASIESTLLHTHIRNNQLVDFYDWSSKSQTNILHLSYVDDSALKNMKSLSVSYQSVIEKGIDPKSPFFFEIYDVDKKEYKHAHSESVNMIDQLLIAIQYEQIKGTPPKKFDKWLKKEFTEKGKVYGNYNRATLNPRKGFESSAVYALATLYFLDQEDHKYASEFHKRLVAQPPFNSGANYSTIHFFDYIYSKIADYEYQH